MVNGVNHLIDSAVQCGEMLPIVSMTWWYMAGSLPGDADGVPHVNEHEGRGGPTMNSPVMVNGVNHRTDSAVPCFEILPGARPEQREGVSMTWRNMAGSLPGDADRVPHVR